MNETPTKQKLHVQSKHITTVKKPPSLSSLRDIIQEAAKKLLFGNSKNYFSWKVLITDQPSHTLVLSLFSKNELRSSGVTLTFSIHGKREPMPEVAAVYLLRPTLQCIQHCAKDIIEHRYAEYRICFVEICPIAVLECLAKEITQVGDISNVTIFDFPLRTIALEKNLYSLQIPHSLSEVMTIGTGTTDTSTSATCDGLYDILQLLKIRPKIAFVDSPITRSIASNIEKRISSFSQDEESSRKHVMLLVDRNHDVISPLVSPFTYGELVADILHLKSNFVTVSEKDLNKIIGIEELKRADFFIRSENEYSIPLIGDKFWEKYQSCHFGQLCVDLEREFDAFQRDRGTLNNEGRMSAVLAAAPELAERKSVLDKHTILSKLVLEKINERSLDKYHELSVDIFSAYQRRELCDFTDQVVHFIASPASKGNWSDRARLFCIFAVYAHWLEDQVKGNIRLVHSICIKLNDRFPEHVNNTNRIAKCAASVHRFYSSYSSEKAHRSPLEWIDMKLASVANKISSSLNATERRITLPLTKLIASIFLKEHGDKAAGAKLVSLSATNREEKNQLKLRDKISWIDDKQCSNSPELILVCVIGGFTYGEYFDLIRWQRESEYHNLRCIFGGSEPLSGENFIKMMTDV